MTMIMEEFSTITLKGQTTVPKAVRKALGVDFGGRIAFRIDDGNVTVVRADLEEDKSISAFLNFLADDIIRRPETIKALSPELVARITMLIGTDFQNLNEEIVGNVTL